MFYNVLCVWPGSSTCLKSKQLWSPRGEPQSCRCMRITQDPSNNPLWKWRESSTHLWDSTCSIPLPTAVNRPVVLGYPRAGRPGEVMTVWRSICESMVVDGTFQWLGCLCFTHDTGGNLSAILLQLTSINSLFHQADLGRIVSWSVRFLLSVVNRLFFFVSLWQHAYTNAWLLLLKSMYVECLSLLNIQICCFLHGFETMGK